MKIQELEEKRKDFAHKTLAHDKAILSVQVDKSLSDELMRIAVEEHVNKSDLMRHIFKTFIEDYNKEG